MPQLQPVRAARGVRDILPAARPTWARVERAAGELARRFGYQEIEVPIIEPAALIERGVGGDTDVVRKEIYRLAQPAEGGGADLALRPVATAGVVRAYFEGGLNQGPQPVRLFTMGPMFRHDRPQAGRYRQFHQFDVEVIGDEGPAYDAEVIELTWSWLRNLGLRGLGLEVNSIGDPACRPAYLERLRAYYRPLRDQLHLDCQRRVEENPLRLLDCKEPQCQPFREAAPKITDHLCGPCAEHFERVRGLLRAAEIPFRLNPYLVRGLDYYTRTVFEYQHQALGGAQNALGGGGRYDGLAEALGFPAAAGVGFAGGLDRIVLMLDEQRRQERDEQGERGEGAEPPPEGPDLLLLPDGADLDSATAEVARRARATVSVAADFSRRSLRAKMRAAGRSGCPWVAIMSPDEAGRRVVQLRDMTTGEQREVGWDALADALARDVATTGDGR